MELSKLMGATAIAHAQGPEKLAIARRAVADHLIDASEDLRARVIDLGGADVVYDAIGGDVFKVAFRSTNPEGRILPIGFASGDIPQIPANHLLVKNPTVVGLYIGAYLTHRFEIFRQSLDQLMAWNSAGKLCPPIHRVLPLEEVEWKRSKPGSNCCVAGRQSARSSSRRINRLEPVGRHRAECCAQQGGQFR